MKGKIDVAGILMAAYAHGEATGGSVDWADIDDAFALACSLEPGRYEQILGMIEESISET